ncbi:MAG: TetR/AcrR family transcriptional regulator [Bacteroidales bacterium]|nr:TetR/AcrR family transcriptional regulator [Bacteroidales bacterium]
MSNNSDEARTKILDVAHKLFDRYGFDKTSMDEIAKASHKSKSSLYYYFESKEELFKTLIREELNRMKAVIMPIMTEIGITETERIKKYVRQRMESGSSASMLLEALKINYLENFFISHFDFLTELRSDLDKWEREQLTTMFSAGKQKGEFIDQLEVNSAVDMSLMLIRGLEFPFFIERKYQTYKDPFDYLLDNTLQGISVKHNNLK